jgi:hypothetical protein
MTAKHSLRGDFQPVFQLVGITAEVLHQKDAVAIAGAQIAKAALSNLCCLSVVGFGSIPVRLE